MQQGSFSRASFKVRTLTPLHIRSNHILCKDRDYYLQAKKISRIHYPDFALSLPATERDKILLQVENKGIHALLTRPAKKKKQPRVEEDWKKALRAKAGFPTEEEKAEEQAKIPEGESEPLPVQIALQKAELYNLTINSGDERVGSKIYGLSLDHFQRFLLPGSTLKGALRTAIYFHTLQQNSERLERMRFTWSNDPKEADYPLNREISGFDQQQPHKDIFSQLIVRDSFPISQAEKVSICPIKILTIKKDQEKTYIGWKSEKSAARHEGSHWEILLPNVELETEILFAKNQDLHTQVPIVLEPQVMIQATRAFSAWIIQEEINFAEKYDIPFLHAFYVDLQKKLTDTQDENTTFLPLGCGLPWHAKTVGGTLAQENLDGIRRHFYRYMGKFIHMPHEVVFHGMMVKRGRCPKTGRLLRPEKLECIHPFPKTRHIVFYNGNSLPLGWVELVKLP